MTDQQQLPEGTIPLLDYGFVRLVDSMGDDAAIVQAARVSYGKGTKTVNEDQGLINHLFRNRHTSPFEMVTLKFHAKMPIFVARQWVRHRTASLNEYSGRYSEMVDQFYLPELDRIQGQDTANKQGSDGEQIATAKDAQDIMQKAYDDCYAAYQNLLERGVSKELARLVLPVGNYTEWYWQINLHNLMHFLRLRLDSHAQPEIQVYAQAMYDLIQPIVPMTLAAYERYQVVSIDTQDAEEGAE